MPDYKKLSNYQPPISSRVYSKDGKLIAEYALEKRLFVPYDSIPSKIIDSFLSAEDKNFFNHPGIDAKGIIRANINNITNRIKDQLYKKNLLMDKDELIPYATMDRIFLINKVKVLNHKWLIADFSDGTDRGELLIAFKFNKSGNIDFELKEHFLYPTPD